MKFQTTKQHYRNKAIRSLFVLLTISLVAFGYLSQQPTNPLPTKIKQVVNFKVIYPYTKLVKVNGESYQYISDKNVLIFTAIYNNHYLAFTEQPAPESLGSDSQPYYQALGIHPYAQFKINLGQVALTKFWQSGNLLPAGQSGLLSSKGTFLTVRTNDSLSNQDWKIIFSSLKVTR